MIHLIYGRPSPSNIPGYSLLDAERRAQFEREMAGRGIYITHEIKTRQPEMESILRWIHDTPTFSPVSAEMLNGPDVALYREAEGDKLDGIAEELPSGSKWRLWWPFGE
jgi:hypothetical protein